MGTKRLLHIFGMALALACLSFTDPYAIKRITDTSFKHEFYTIAEQVKVKPGRLYYWFKGGAIHQSEAGVAGELLHNQYTKLYLNNQLAEQGNFLKGLKTGLWKTWYPDGTLQSEQLWKFGMKNGESLQYNPQGVLIEKGYYRDNAKHKKWIDCIKNDTVVYKKGVVFVEKPKLTAAEKAQKPGFFKRIFTKKQPAAAQTDTPEPVKKPNFLQRLFSKKETKPEVKSEAAKSPEAAKTQNPNFFKRLFTKKQTKQKQANG